LTFISIHSVIIYVVFFGACMRCTRLCSLKPGVIFLHLRATPFLTEGVGACASSPYSSDCSPDTDSRSGPVAIARPRGCFTSCVHHRFRRRRTSRSSFRPSPCSSSPTCCPRPWSQPRADRRSSTWVRGESVMLLVFLRVCRRGGHSGACHA
jgi:hypothetical protein